MSQRRLRIGLLLDDFIVPSWVARIIQFIHSDSRLSIDLIVMDASSRKQAPRSLFQKVRKNNFIYNRYVDWERKRVADVVSRFPDQDLRRQLSDIPLLAAKPRGKRFIHRFSRSTIARIGSRKLDILLRFGFKILKGEILKAAEFGVWSYHHGDNDYYRGGPAGFWEVYDQVPVTGITLQVLTEELDGGIVLGKTFLSTDLSSPVRNQFLLHAASQRVFEDAIEAVFRHSLKRESFFGAFAPSPRPYGRKLYTAPTNSQMLFFFISRLIPRFVRARLPGATKREQWFVGIGPSQGFSPLGRTGMPQKICWKVPDVTRFYADPFLARIDGRTAVFMEDFDYLKNKGVISAAEVDGQGNLMPAAPVLEREFHLSFPFVMEHEGRLLMLPEQSQARSLAFYESDRFLGPWKEVARIFDGIRLVDSVVLAYEGRFWLFTTRPYDVEHHNNLYLFHSRNLFDGWTPHPCNPIKSTLRGARMAGSIIRQGEQLVRPGQNCIGAYGRSIVFFEIVRLNEREYEEREIGELLHNDGVPGNTKIHTINMIGDLLVVDGSRMVRLP